MKWKVTKKASTKLLCSTWEEGNQKQRTLKNIWEMLIHLEWRTNQLLYNMPVYWFKIADFRRHLLFLILWLELNMKRLKSISYFRFQKILMRIMIRQKSTKRWLLLNSSDLTDRFQSLEQLNLTHQLVMYQYQKHQKKVLEVAIFLKMRKKINLTSLKLNQHSKTRDFLKTN